MFIQQPKQNNHVDNYENQNKNKNSSKNENSIYVDYELNLDPRYNQNVSYLQNLMNSLYATPSNQNNTLLNVTLPFTNDANTPPMLVYVPNSTSKFLSLCAFCFCLLLFDN